jgi:hypothetical protein
LASRQPSSPCCARRYPLLGRKARKFTDRSAGTINAFNPVTGQFVGTVSNAAGTPLGINLLWGISFGSGTAANGATNQLFYTAGSGEYATGTFGVINVQP